MLTWTFGEVRVTRLQDLEQPPIDPADLLPAASAAQVRQMHWLHPQHVDHRGWLRMSFHCFLIQTPELTVLVDTGVGTGKFRDYPLFDDLKSPFLDELAHAGVSTSDVDLLICTHLHFDHVGWNTQRRNGRWVPTFPRATLLTTQMELDHGCGHGHHELHGRAWVDSVRPLMERGLVRAVASDLRVSSHIRLIPTPGHSPGHVSVRVSSRGAEALITGDMIHHPVQLEHPHWSTVWDADGIAAAASRRSALDDLCDRNGTLLGSHFSEPSGGRIRRIPGGFRFESAPVAAGDATGPAR